MSTIEADEDKLEAAFNAAVAAERQRCIADVCPHCAEGQPLYDGCHRIPHWTVATGYFEAGCPAEPIRRRVAREGAARTPAVATRPRGVAGDRCEYGNECGRTGCEWCQQ